MILLLLAATAGTVAVPIIDNATVVKATVDQVLLMKSPRDVNS